MKAFTSLKTAISEHQPKSLIKSHYKKKRIYRRSTSGGLAITAAAFNVYRRFKPPLKRHTAPTVQPLFFFDIAHPSPWVLSLPPSLVFNTGSQDLPRW
ncbi:hypothetical protein QL285_048650 [Trifolium repens]|nr:hypothetical protein QL285_048650 [Trifolium repens]